MKPTSIRICVLLAGLLMSTGLFAQTFTVYDTSNSALPANIIYKIASDANGDMWIASVNNGLFRFNGTTCSVYNSTNSVIPADFVYAVNIDQTGEKWIGTLA
ncbi:MAG: hypothetical protein KKD31_07435 [Bacteroidetes bacterium]|nr:hypothetical protein [Bacteroidota bacterium]